MPLSMAAKAALCACPPALMVGAAATVPAVKRAVHHATAGRTVPKPVRRAAPQSARPATASAPQRVDCAPALVGELPAVPLVTYAAPIPDEPAGQGSTGFAGSGGGPVVGAIGLAPGGTGTTPTTPVTPGIPGAGAVPEPSVWLMMITGVGALGATLRRRRRRSTSSGSRAYGFAGRASVGGGLWTSAAVEAGDVATFTAVKSSVVGAAGKALLCVCPAVVMAGSVLTVPPLRQAVHAATLVPGTPPVIAGTGVTPPCVEAVTVPVEASSAIGLPRSVQTVPAKIPAAPPPTA